MNDLTINQLRALKLLTPGRWFYPEECSEWQSIHTRDNTARILAQKNFLIKRPVNRYGQIEFEYMLPLATSVQLDEEKR